LIEDCCPILLAYTAIALIYASINLANGGEPKSALLTQGIGCLEADIEIDCGTIESLNALRQSLW